MQALANPGVQFVVQVVFHAALAALAVEGLLKSWEVRGPGARARFRLLVLALPLVAWPLFQLAHPARGSDEFRAGPALFDLNAWLEARAWEVPLVWPFAALLGANAAVFILQELLPAIRQQLAAREGARQPLSPRVARAAERVTALFGMGWDPGAFHVVDSETPIAYTAGLTRQRTVLSRSLVDMLDDDELEAVLAHELAHRRKHDNAAGWASLVAGALAFYSPAALFELRLMAHDRELACDDLAARTTGRPLALASALIKASRGAGGALHFCRSGARASPVAWLQAVGNSARRAQLHERVLRLTRPTVERDVPWLGLRLALTTVSLSALLFFVV